MLTHHYLKNQGKRSLILSDGSAPTLQAVSETGSGNVQAREKALLREIIEKVNDLFEGELSDGDKLVYVNHVIKGKLLASLELRQPATNNSKEQFANSPDLASELTNAIIDALDAHTSMSTQALNSTAVQNGLKSILLNHAALWEGPRHPSVLWPACKSFATRINRACSLTRHSGRLR